MRLRLLPMQAWLAVVFAWAVAVVLLAVVDEGLAAVLLLLVGYMVGHEPDRPICDICARELEDEDEEPITGEEADNAARYGIVREDRVR